MGWPTITGVANFGYKIIISITTITITAIVIIVTATIITIQCIKAFTTEITTQITVINTVNIIIELVVANITIIDIITTTTTTTTNHCFRGLLAFTLHGYQDTASTQRNSRNLLLPLTNDEWRCQQNSWRSCQ